MSRRQTAIAVGILFWVSNLVTLVGAAVAGATPTTAAGLSAAARRATEVNIGTLIAQVNGVAIVGYALLLLPVLRRSSDGLARGYVAFKVTEAVLLAVGAVVLLGAVAAGPDSGASSPAAANIALGQQFWAGRLAALAYLVATPMLVAVLYRARLVPRFISLWGAAGLAMLAAGLAMGVGDPTRGFQVEQLLVIPILLWELFFATWLIVRGFAGDVSTAQRRPATAGADHARLALPAL